MILKRLCEAAERFKFPPPGYTYGPIKWLIDLDSEGRLLGFTKLAETERANDRGRVMLHPVVARTSGVKAQLLADKAEYALGCAPDSKPERTARCHQAFKALLKACADATDWPPIRAVLAYLQDNLDPTTFPDELAAEDMVTFRVDGRILVHEPPVQEYWSEAVAQEAGERGGDEQTCLVCGQVAPIADRHPIKIKRIPGGQSSGCTIVSANEDAYNSYGRKAGLISPVCWDCARNYAQVLNELLADPARSYRVSDQLVYVFWTRETAAEFSVAALFSDPQPEDVRRLLQSVERGSPGAVEADAFYALALSGSGGRVVVRDWLETTVDRAQRNIARYFEAQEIVEPDGRPGAPLKLMALMGALIPSTGSNPWQQLPPGLARDVIRTALTGGRLPEQVLYRAVARGRAEQGMTRPRAALIKMCLVMSGHPEEGLQLTPEMNPQIEDPAYLCGRLLAILENIQRAAIPGAKTTVVDRYYGTASSAPASVFGNLIRQAQAHLSKLRKTRPGAYVALQAQLEEVAARLPEFPRTLTLIDQGKFGLGYYQQRAADRAARAEAVAAKQAANEETTKEES